MSAAGEGVRTYVTLPQEAWAQLCADVAAVKTLLAAREGRALPDRPMSPAEFARAIGRHEKTVRRWIARGKLRAVHEGRTMLITPVNAQRFLNPPTAASAPGGQRE